MMPPWIPEELNLDCKKAIEGMLSRVHRRTALKAGCGEKKSWNALGKNVDFVMANTIRELSHDGRFSRQNKTGRSISEVPEMSARVEIQSMDYVIESLLTVLDGFI